MISVNKPDLSGNEKKYLLDCIESEWISSEGPFVEQFESQFAKTIGRAYSTAVSSGSAALDIALKLANLKPGDEVLVPTFTIISPVFSILKQGATPVLLESESFSWNVDIEKIEGRITSNTKAIVIIHTYGLPVDVDPLLSLCRKYNLFIIEDAAEVHGLRYKDQNCGTFGDVSTFSFYPNKHITTGEGGMVLTNSDDLDKKAKELRNLSFSANKRFVHHDFGWNYRMTNMQAALGVAQLERLPLFLQKKQLLAGIYDEMLSDRAEFRTPLKELPYGTNCYWVFGLLFDKEKEKDRIVAFLRDRKVGTRPFFWCMHEQPVFIDRGLFLDDHFPVAEKMARNGIYLPLGLGHTEEEIRTVAQYILDAYA